MRFPSIPISYAIADVRAELKRLNQSGEINDEDCINYAIECIREIGGYNYPDDKAVVTVCNHLADLPKNLYMIDELWLCQEAHDNTIIPGLISFTHNHKHYQGKRLLFPGDAFTGSKYCKKYQTPRDINEPTYIVRGGQLRCSIQNCIIGIKFLSMISNDGNGYMMQDEIYSIKAVKAYIKTKILYEKWVMQEVPDYIYKSVEREYDINLDQAQAMMKFEDPADDKAKGYKQDHRYDDFRLR